MNRIKLITGIVIAAHVSVVVAMSLSSALSPRKKSTRPMVVKTIQPKTMATPPASVAAAPAAVVATPPVKKEEVKPPTPAKKPTPPVAKKEPVKKPVATKKAAPPPPKKVEKAKAPPPETPKIPKKLLQDLEESIAKIEGKHISKTPSNKKADLPAPAQELEEEVDLSFHEVIVSYLHQALNLPEHGEVKIELTLRTDGSVARLVVLKSESEKNKSYLEKSLPSLKFPILDGMFSNKSQQTFILTFCNEL